MKVFDIFVGGNIKGRNYRFFRTCNYKIVGDEELHIADGFYLPKEIYEDISRIEYVSVESNYHNSPNEPYPDFITITFGAYCINQKAKQLLLDNEIKFSTIPINVINNDSDQELEYELVIFPRLKEYILDFEKSDIELKGEVVVTKGEDTWYPVKPPCIKKELIEKISGIVQLKEFNFYLVCDEIIKGKIEKAKLNGIDFNELEQV